MIIGYGLSSKILKTIDLILLSILLLIFTWVSCDIKVLVYLSLVSFLVFATL